MTALASGQVDRVLVIPCLQHALNKALPNFAHRLEMTRLAFAPLAPNVLVSDVEGSLEAPSRTYNTLLFLKAQNPDWTFRLVVGADIPNERSSWYRITDVEALAPLLVVGRPNVSGAQGLLLPELSSTDIRNRIRNGEPLLNLVPASVAQYVEQHGLYKAP